MWGRARQMVNIMGLQKTRKRTCPGIQAAGAGQEKATQLGRKAHLQQ
jgi:hypothetical protein